MFNNDGSLVSLDSFLHFCRCDVLTTHRRSCFSPRYPATEGGRGRAERCPCKDLGFDRGNPRRFRTWKHGKPWSHVIAHTNKNMGVCPYMVYPLEIVEAKKWIHENQLSFGYVHTCGGICNHSTAMDVFHSFLTENTNSGGARSLWVHLS